ncbi:MAG TPA: hypothetical protein VN786_09770 [Acidimicrobiales bacterium]|nr:hypothetical protein [Acidimicrobiales bacterium]
MRNTVTPSAASKSNKTAATVPVNLALASTPPLGRPSKGAALEAGSPDRSRGAAGDLATVPIVAKDPYVCMNSVGDRLR